MDDAKPTDKTIILYYFGPDGDVNYDVARDSGGSAILEHGKHYEVSRPLAVRLIGLVHGWKEREGQEVLGNQVRKLLKVTDKIEGEASEANPQERDPLPPSPPAGEGGTPASSDETRSKKNDETGKDGDN